MEKAPVDVGVFKAFSTGFVTLVETFAGTCSRGFLAGLPFDASSGFVGPSFVTGRLTEGALLGGDVVLGFSAAFDAEAVVGRIIRARKPSAAGAGWCGRLLREVCALAAVAAGGGPSEGRLLLCFRVEGLRPNPDFVVATLALLGDRELA